MKNLSLVTFTILACHIVSSFLLDDENMKRKLYSSSSSHQECVSCIYSGKWCSYDLHDSSGYCCDSDEDTYYCGNTGYYECSDDDEFGSISGYALCPTYEGDCGTQSYSFYSDGSSYTFSSNYFSTNTVCTYQLDTSNSFISGYDLIVNSLTNAKAYIYLEETRYALDYEGTIYNGDTVSFDVDDEDDAYIVIIPTSSNAYVSFTTTSYEGSGSYDSPATESNPGSGIISGPGSGSSSSSSSTSSSSSGIGGGAIAGIVIGAIVLFGLLMAFGLYRAYKKRQLIAQANNRAAAARAQNNPPAVVVAPSPPPPPQPESVVVIQGMPAESFPQQTYAPQMYYNPYVGYPGQPMMIPVDPGMGQMNQSQPYPQYSYPVQPGYPADPAVNAGPNPNQSANV